MHLCTDNSCILLSSAYLAPVHYYTKIYQCAVSGAPVIEERADHYVKQTYRNRCIIAGDDGPIALTIPVSAPATLPDPSTSSGQVPHTLAISKTPMHAVLLSDHGNWRHQHWQAIVSAYRSTPYFDYYADDFERIFHNDTKLLVDFNAALRDLVLDCLDLHPCITVNTELYLDARQKRGTSTEREGGKAFDFRETIRPKIHYSFDPHFCPVPYYQVFAQRHGFLPNMSIIDLLFNMGPESRIVLRNSCSS